MSAQSGSAVKPRDRQTRPGFRQQRPTVLLPKIRLCSASFDFFPALPKIKGGGSSLEQTNTQAPLNHLVPNVVKPLGPICDKENAGATSTK